MMICIIVAGNLILVELPTDWMPIRSGHQNAISGGFIPVLGHVMLYQPRRGTNKPLWSATQEALPLVGDSWYWSFLLSGKRVSVVQLSHGVLFTYHSVLCSWSFSLVR